MHCSITEGEHIWGVQENREDSWASKGLLRVKDELKTALNQEVGMTQLVDITPILNGSGGISCRSVYELLRRKGVEVGCGGFLWRNAQCKRWAFIVWLAAKRRLQTRDKLHTWGISASPRSLSFV